MNKKGFTLIEILAVIVILGVIMVIAVPFVTGYIERSKRNALLSTADGFIDSVVLYHSSNVEESDKVFIFDATRNGETTDGEKIDFKGKFTGTGSVRLYQDGKTAICISDGKYFALKNINDTEIKTGEGLCSYDEATNNYSSIELVSKEQVDELQNQLDQANAKISELNNKISIDENNLTSLLTNKGITLTGDEELSDLIDLVSTIKGDITHQTFSFDHTISNKTSPTYTDTFQLPAGKYYIIVSSMCYVSNEYHTNTQTLANSSGTLTKIASRIPRYHEDITDYFTAELTENTNFSLTVSYVYNSDDYARPTNSFVFVVKIA
ncbi:MAG: prepilin-type N-terminal cleavage/methylation domain-containing protein [Bacilli bacterium]|nr:prepilin-type N-terminal cleavage/methylation domain-containing protein [Bacilli bacterium]